MSAAVPQWASVSPACQESGLTPTLVFGCGPGSQRREGVQGHSGNWKEEEESGR